MKKIASISDLQAITEKENGEQLIDLSRFPQIRCDYRRADSPLQAILVRKCVAQKLVSIQEKLSKIGSLQLLVVEGYRLLSYQESYFFREFQLEIKKGRDYNLDDLLEKTHQRVALPSVSGHPTGGAVDVTILDHGLEVPMGGVIADFTYPEKLPTFSTAITQQEANNRKLLHDHMVADGFAPFYGEWWHFSYGDREWAAFYNRPHSLYSSL